jgi:hypothetical protein
MNPRRKNRMITSRTMQRWVNDEGRLRLPSYSPLIPTPSRIFSRGEARPPHPTFKSFFKSLSL